MCPRNPDKYVLSYKTELGWRRNANFLGVKTFN